MRYALIFAAGLLAATFTGSIVADVVNVQPPDAFNTVMASTGWLPGQKVYDLANTSLDWVYWQGNASARQAVCYPAGGWIAPGASMDVTICPAAAMATAGPGTYSDQVTFNFDPRLVGDVTGDGNVDVADLLTLVPAFGTQAGDPAYDIACDFNGDGLVDVVDLLDLVDTFGMTYGSLPV